MTVEELRKRLEQQPGRNYQARKLLRAMEIAAEKISADAPALHGLHDSNMETCVWLTDWLDSPSNFHER